MKRYILFTFTFLFSTCLPAQAQQTSNDSIDLWYFGVSDGFYEKEIKNARITVFEADSTTVLCDSLPKDYWAGREPTDENFRGYKGRLPLRSVYVFKVEAPGYSEAWLSYRLKKSWGKYPKGFYMKEKARLFEATDYNLGEATATASRIQFVVKGDTIEYNAAAFKLAEGSMLDNLVRALPGATLDDDGRISVNGQFVKSLLVNGRDFFRGDPKVALSNLPAYTVNKIRVYHDRWQETDDTRRTAGERENDPLVMDVRLKREYAQGWIANIETGWGSNLQGGWDDKWLARLFAMRYTNHSSLAFFANTNNLNEASTPGSKGSWRKSEPSAGEKKTYMAGVDFSLTPKDTYTQLNTSVQAQRQEAQNLMSRNEETFYTGGSVFDHSRSDSRSTTTELRWNTSLELQDHGENFKHSLYYTHNKQRTDNPSVQLHGLAVSDLDTLYSRERYSRLHETGWGTALDLGNRRGIRLGEKGGMLSYSGACSYNHTRVDNVIADAISYRHHAADNWGESRSLRCPATDYSYSVGGTYFAPKLFKGGKTDLALRIAYQYGQDFNSGEQQLKRSTHSLTPSGDDALEWLVDRQNSYHTTRLERRHTITPTFILSWDKFFIDLKAEMQAIHRRINDLRNAEAKHQAYSNFVCNPTLSMQLGETVNGQGTKLRLEGRVAHTLPDLLSLLNVRDESDPMVTYYGNSGLRTERGYHAKLSFDWQTQDPAWRYVYMRTAYSRWENSIGRMRLYDRSTGITTYRPENINGNWQTSATCGIQVQDWPKGLRWDYRFEGIYRHSNDFASDEASAEAPTVLTTASFTQTHELLVKYRIKDVVLAAKANLSRTQMRSKQHVFDRFAYTDFNYGLSLTSPVLWGIDIDTDLMAYCRRGYNDASMNTTDWVWNASLSKAIGKRKQWVVKAVGFDLLHQISTTRRTVNAQGRTEVWYNTVPAYLTLNLMYRIDIKPQKSKR